MKNPLRNARRGFFVSVEPMRDRSNFHPEDLIKIFEFLEIVEGAGEF